jgi:hypothetical protein
MNIRTVDKERLTLYAFCTAFDKSLVYVDTKELPQGWVRDHLLGRQRKLSEQVC